MTNIDALQVPKRGFTKAERVWLAEIIKAVKTARGVAGRNVTISDTESGQLVNASDCPICPPTP